MKLIQMSVKGISYSDTQTGAYALILSEEDGAVSYTHLTLPTTPYV